MKREVEAESPLPAKIRRYDKNRRPAVGEWVDVRGTDWFDPRIASVAGVVALAAICGTVVFFRREDNPTFIGTTGIVSPTDHSGPHPVPDELKERIFSIDPNGANSKKKFGVERLIWYDVDILADSKPKVEFSFVGDPYLHALKYLEPIKKGKDGYRAVVKIYVDKRQKQWPVTLVMKATIDDIDHSNQFEIPRPFQGQVTVAKPIILKPKSSGTKPKGKGQGTKPEGGKAVGKTAGGKNHGGKTPGKSEFKTGPTKRFKKGKT